ncbi:2383_t:CDS:10 [Dentiscutata erythropus]|uniref:2383_t:CDS:1 n=1 Tax=Dentiscutata erythropus TaxID=1348616 RepID=A0A9N9NHC9_9GLOM|nr:2383_t:CDS:10 [Dentiscutata erythropus]
MAEKKLIKDPIHGYMEFEDWAVKFIDTPQFQRLRDIKQLGTAFYIFPGATHTRFEHSLVEIITGTAHLAYTLTKRLQEQKGKSDDDDRNLKCVTLAALCHDLGHGPYSHLFDRDFIQDCLGIKWKHEDGSVTMFKDLLEKNSINLNSIGLIHDEDVEIIEALIRGKSDQQTKRQIPKYLFEIVNNERNSIDVDKFDYFTRDCYYAGVKRSFDFSRLMRLSCVKNDKIVYYHKECYLIYDLFHTRYSLHKTVYKHRIVRAIDHMICDVLKGAKQYLAKKYGFKDFEDAINNAEKYIRLSDSIFHEIEHSEDKELEKSKGIIKQIKERKLYKFVDEYLTKPKKESEKKNITEDIMDEITNSGVTLCGEYIKHDDIIIDWISFDYGKKDKNPVKDVEFYNKTDDEPFNIMEEDVSYLLPVFHKEETVRIYLRTKGKEEKTELKRSIALIKNALKIVFVKIKKVKFRYI